MITMDDLKTLNDVKFSFCEHCSFYECELIREYTQFHKRHFKIATSKESDKPIPIVKATAIKVEANELDKDTTTTPHIFQAAASFPIEEKEDIDFLSYDQEELKNGCMMSIRHVIQVECGRGKVTDGIGDHYQIEIGRDFGIETDTVDRWEPSQPVFISAQTGQGKNYFIENALIPYVKRLNIKNRTNQKVLILSNRLALKCQIKKRLDGNDDPDNEEGQIYPYKEFADVMTYQSLLEQMRHLEKVQANGVSKYIYIICDEAHFFTSDAMFNPHTHKILSAIVKLFSNAIRVYMSATPYECLEYIIKYESIYKSQCPMAFYHFKRDYSYLNIFSYSSIRELYNEIVMSVNHDGKKWLIFIDDKEKCKTVKEELEVYGNDAGCPMIIEYEDSKISKIFAVDATSKKNEDYRAIVEAEKLIGDTRVLITTSVLDNGVNLTGIDNIVISDMSKVKCLQMVGRARVKGYDPKTLYIKRFDEKYVKNRLYDFEEQRAAYHSYEMAYVGPDNPFYSKKHYLYSFLSRYYDGNDKDWNNAKHWFGRSLEEPNELYLNDIAHFLLEKLISKYQFIADEMSDEREQQEILEKRVVGQEYLEYQLSWFGNQYDVDNDITLVDKKKAEKAFMDFLESYADDEKHISKGEKESFKSEFTQLFDIAFQRQDPNKTRIYDIDKMNKLLKARNIGYQVKADREKTPSRPTYWVVVRFDWETEQAE